MSCASTVADLSAWIDGELPAPRAAEVAAHVAACASCRAQADALRRVDAALRAVPPRELRPGAFAELSRRIERGAVRSDPLRVARWSAGAAAAAAGIALYLAYRPIAPDPLDTATPEELDVAIDLDTAEDLDVIANLEVLEALVAQDDGGRG